LPRPGPVAAAADGFNIERPKPPSVVGESLDDPAGPSPQPSDASAPGLATSTGANCRQSSRQSGGGALGQHSTADDL